MSPRPKTSGFTIVEILVTLVLLGLIASVVAPGMDAWLTARNKAAIRSAFSSQMALMPLQASRQGTKLVIDAADQLDIEGIEVRFIEPVRILKNGFCLGGEVELDFGLTKERYLVMPPLCEVQRASG